MNYLLLSHCFLFDESQKNKIDIFNYTINFFKEKYKNLHIIVTGHGKKEYSHLINADTLIWYDYIESEFGQGHPKCVLSGLEKAKKLGAKKILKMRLDSFTIKEDIFNFCDNILEKENTKCLITAMTNLPEKWIGDLFMYGDIDFLIDIWDEKKWNYNLRDGMVNLYSIYKDKYSPNIRDYFSFRSKSFKLNFFSGLSWPKYKLPLSKYKSTSTSYPLLNA